MTGIVADGSLVGVIGAGTMGAGIAQVALVAGHRVALHDKVDGAAGRAVAGLVARLDSLARKGRLAVEDAEAAKARLTVADDLGAFEGAVLIIEAIVENLAVKQGLFTALEDVVSEDCLLATNTSSLSVTAIAAGLKGPGRLVGMHFFNPAPLLPLVEVVSGLATDPAAADRVAAYAEAWGKTTVRCASTPGFIVNRVARPFYSEALRAYEEGAADFATIDAVLKQSAGFKMGPFELMDMIGLDVNLAVSTSVWEATGHDPRYTPAWTQKEHVAAGRTGRKSGQGFYDYAEGAEKPEPRYADETDAAPASAPTSALRMASLIGSPTTPAGPDRCGLVLPSGTRLARCEGRTATSYGDGRILVDLALDYHAAETWALAPAVDTPPAALAEAVALVQALGKKVLVVKDLPGMIATRTVARIVNEAVDALARLDAGADDIDLAMRLGVNYPRGPIEWGANLGMSWVLSVLTNLDDTYRDGRYRASVLLRTLAGEVAERPGQRKDGTRGTTSD